MRPLVIIPPIMALAISAAWIGSRRYSRAAVEEQSALLQKRIATTQADGETGNAGDGGKANGKSATSKGAIDWRSCATKMAEHDGESLSAIRESIRLQILTDAMSVEELKAALAEMALLELSPDGREMLERMLLSSLAQKDPKAFLAMFPIDRAWEARRWEFSEAMSNWMKKDPASALAWFDRQIAEGAFDSKSLDGRNEMRTAFEGKAVWNLLSSDPVAANERLAALPEDQRARVLYFHDGDKLEAKDQVAFADMIRSQLPLEEQAGSLAWHAQFLVRSGGLDEVDAFLDRIQASPAEREATAGQSLQHALRKVAGERVPREEDFDRLREWAKTQAPANAERLTGETLFAASQSHSENRVEFATASDVVLKYHSESGSDEVIVGFLQHQSFENKEECRILVNKISDPKKREPFEQRLK